MLDQAPTSVLSRIPALPFVKLAGQEDMKLALLLNVVDSSIGGVLIMGDRGTGKSVAVRVVLSRSGCWSELCCVASQYHPCNILLRGCAGSGACRLATGDPSRPRGSLQLFAYKHITYGP